MSNNPGSRVTSTGLAVMLLAVSAGVGSSDSAVLLGLAGVLVGASTIAIGVSRMGKEEDQNPITPTDPVAFAGVDTFSATAFLHRNLATVGLILASSAVTAVAVEAGPLLCCTMFALLLLGLCLINIRVLRE